MKKKKQLNRKRRQNEMKFVCYRLQFSFFHLIIYTDVKIHFIAYCLTELGWNACSFLHWFCIFIPFYVALPSNGEFLIHFDSFSVVLHQLWDKVISERKKKTSIVALAHFIWIKSDIILILSFLFLISIYSLRNP